MFSRSDRQAGKELSFIGPEVTVTGDLDTEGRLHIDGKIAGDVRCASLSQGESGTVHGNIVAGEARLAGLVDGAVEAGTLVLEASARVTGDVLYETLSIAAGAQIEGRLRRRRSGEGAAAAQPAVRPVRQAPELFAHEPATAIAAE
jgi:cytoskeletal protein CcmA (bactofilin family)